MLSRTLAQLRAQVARFLDEPIATSGKHTEANAAISINAAIRRYALMLAEGGLALETVATLTTSASATEADGWAANANVDLPSDFMLLKSLSVQDGSIWVPMVPFEESERNNWEGLWGSASSGLPTHYRIGTDNAGNAMLRLLPPADAAYSIRCIYYVTPTELSADGDTYSFIPGTEEWVELEAAIDMLGSDGADETAQLQLWMRKQQLAEARIKKFRRLGQGPRRKINTKALRANAERRAGPWLRGV